ncbi:NAD(P)/FAD-dependent oxidoreductase, partial [Streptomyces sp. SID625]|nr:NAD(P)/FAD-dependent oxidoreductase [Streptomyces sp. SID625]
VHAPDPAQEFEALFGSGGAGGAGLPARPTVVVARPGDPALVPDPEHEAVTLTATVPTQGSAAAAGPRELAAHADRMITAAARAVPGLRDRLLWHEVRTPAD